MSFGQPDFWTTGKVDHLLVLRVQRPPLSATQMGIILGCSRNAVIGKLRRMKLALPSGGRPARAIPKPRSATAPAKRTNQERAIVTVMRNRARAAREAAPFPERLIEADHVEDMRCLALEELEGKSCRFPLWGRQERNLSAMKFCGRTAADGRPYCDEHARLCFTPVPERGNAQRHHQQRAGVRQQRTDA